MTEFEGWLSTKEAAELTGYSAQYVLRLARKGRILARKAGHSWLINRESLLDYKRRMGRLGPQKFNWRRSGRPGPARPGGEQ